MILKHEPLSVFLSNDQLSAIDLIEDQTQKLIDIARQHGLCDTLEALQSVLVTLPAYSVSKERTGIPNAVYQLGATEIEYHERCCHSLKAGYDAVGLYECGTRVNADALFDAFVQSTWVISGKPAQSLDDLKAKCRVLSYWVGEEKQDLVDQFAASVCRDVAELETINDGSLNAEPIYGAADRD